MQCYNARGTIIKIIHKSDNLFIFGFKTLDKSAMQIKVKNSAAMNAPRNSLPESANPSMKVPW
jgi:hypothetical protein